MPDANRPLTDREKVRTEYVEDLSAEMEEKGYTRRVLTVSIAKANAVGALVALVPAVAFTVWFILRNGTTAFLDLQMVEMLLIGILMFAMIIVHEGIHGLTWAIFSPMHMKQIEFGYIKEMLTPYCYCGAPLKRPAYLTGSLMPCILLGFVPCTVACLCSWTAWLLLGFVMILGAAGDLLISLKLVMVKRGKKELLCLDHPSECGLILFMK